MNVTFKQQVCDRLVSNAVRQGAIVQREKNSGGGVFQERLELSAFFFSGLRAFFILPAIDRSGLVAQ